MAFTQLSPWLSRCLEMTYQWHAWIGISRWSLPPFIALDERIAFFFAPNPARPGKVVCQISLSARLLARRHAHHLTWPYFIDTDKITQASAILHNWHYGLRVGQGKNPCPSAYTSHLTQAVQISTKLKRPVRAGQIVTMSQHLTYDIHPIESGYKLPVHTPFASRKRLISLHFTPEIAPVKPPLLTLVGHDLNSPMASPIKNEHGQWVYNAHRISEGYDTTMHWSWPKKILLRPSTAPTSAMPMSYPLKKASPARTKNHPELEDAENHPIIQAARQRLGQPRPS